MVVAAEGLVVARGVKAGLDALLVPDAPEWTNAAESVVGLAPTPLADQPSAYVRVAWERRFRGDVREVRVRALAGKDSVAVRLEWVAANPQRRIDDWDVYADGCAVLFPADGRSAEISTMGSARKPVEGWFWRAGTEVPFSVTAKGFGTVERAKEHSVRARAQWDDGRWQVVLGRPLAADGVSLSAGGKVPVGFAVWCGAAKERAGLKSYSPGWHELRLGD
jgi:DMSO reductase family type II enzyme heme b subunit